MASRVVPTGRRMKGSEKLAPLMPLLRRVLRRLGMVRPVELRLQRRRAAQPRLHALHRAIDDLGGVETEMEEGGEIEWEQVAEQQPADDCDAEGIAQLRSGA